MHGDNPRQAGESAGLRILDIILTLWCLLVAVIFYGGYLDPVMIGLQTGNLIGAYAAMVLLTATIAALRYLRGRPGGHAMASSSGPVSARTDSRQSSGDTDIDR